MKALIVFGTRPEVIKLAPVIRHMPGSIVINTGQHKELADQMLEIFEIIPDYNLNVMSYNQTPSSILATCLKCIDDIIKQHSFDVIIVQGDTCSTLAGALSGYYNNIPVAHVEAGLRTNNMLEPWPEEGNRCMVSAISAYNFCPSNIEYNFMNKNYPNSKNYMTGNTVVDSVMSVMERADKPMINGDYILASIHRRENHEFIPVMFDALNKISKNIKILFLAHPNPNVQKHLSILDTKNIDVLSSVGYLEMVRYMRFSKLILTDSGGIQEEAPSFGVPVLILRNETERPLVLGSGHALLVGNNNVQKIVSAVNKTINRKFFNNITTDNPYGDGDAGKKIAEILNELKMGEA